MGCPGTWKTLKTLRPITGRPTIASNFAELPSVILRVQMREVAILASKILDAISLLSTAFNFFPKALLWSQTVLDWLSIHCWFGYQNA
jgi:hypothetical protein